MKIPGNLNQSHWVLIVVKKSKIIILDPSLSKSEENEDLLNYAKKWKNHFEKTFRIYLPIEAPTHSLQKDDMNCGVFIFWYAHRLINGEPLMGNLDTYYFRKEIILNTILTTSEVFDDCDTVDSR